MGASQHGKTRFCQRIRLQHPLTGMYQTCKIHLRELSPMGAFIDDDLGFHVGQSLPLTFWLHEHETEPIEVQAVVRSVHEHGMGVEFVSLSQADSVRVREFVHAARASEG